MLDPLGHEGDFFNDSHRQPSILCTNGTHPLPLIFPKIFQLMFCTAHAYKDNEIIAKHKENAHLRHVNKCLIYQSAHLEPLNHPFTLCTKNHNTHASIQNITYYNITCNVYPNRSKDYTKKRGNLFLYRLNLLSLHDES